jgi:hypothetical protein
MQILEELKTFPNPRTLKPVCVGPCPWGPATNLDRGANPNL